MYQRISLKGGKGKGKGEAAISDEMSLGQYDKATLKQLNDHFNVGSFIDLDSPVLPQSTAFARIEQEAKREAERELNNEDEDEMSQILDTAADKSSNKKKSFLGGSKKAQKAQPVQEP